MVVRSQLGGIFFPKQILVEVLLRLGLEGPERLDVVAAVASTFLADCWPILRLGCSFFAEILLVRLFLWGHAELDPLTVQLKAKNRSIEQDDYRDENVETELNPVNLFVLFFVAKPQNKCQHEMDYQGNHVQEEKDQKQQEEQVVAVTNAIIDELAMVVETLYALVAEVAMTSLLWPQVFAVDAHVVKMEAVVQYFLEDVDEILPFFNIAWVDQSTQIAEECSG